MKKFIIFVLCFFWSASAFSAGTIDKRVINEMRTTVNKDYLEPVDNAEMIYAGLKTLPELDKALKITKGRDRFYLYYNYAIKSVVPFPQDNKDILGWVEALHKLLTDITKVSEQAELKDFELLDRMMKGMTSKMDKYSGYYSQFEYVEHERDNVIYTLYSDRMIKNILYIKMRTFNKQSAAMVEKSLRENPRAVGVILDFRGNSGGMLNEALKIANMFCENEIITYTAGRDEHSKHYYTAGDKALFTGPMVVMVDGGTASAAEVLAGAFQEQSRAKLIGAHTFGKGTIQNVTEMSNGGKLVLTTEQFFTPSGKVIHKKGIEPDMCLSGKENDVCIRESRLKQDDDIDKAIKLLKNEI